MTIQQMLQLPMSDQVSLDNTKFTLHCSCTRYGTNDRSQTCPRYCSRNQVHAMVSTAVVADGADTASDMVSAKPLVPELIWNFLLANAASNVKAKAENAIRQSLPLADIMPAVLTTRPSSIASASTWFSAVTALQRVASRMSTNEEELRESIDRVLAAGSVVRLIIEDSTKACPHLLRMLLCVLQEQYKIQSTWGKLGF